MAVDAIAVAVVVAFVVVAGIEAAPAFEPTTVLPLADAVEPSPSSTPLPVEPVVAEIVAFALFSSLCSSQAVAIVASMWRHHCRPRRRGLNDKVIPPSAWPFGAACLATPVVRWASSVSIVAHCNKFGRIKIDC